MFESYSNTKINNIFVIRSSTRLFPVVVNELKRIFPKAQISCLTNQKVPEQRSSLHYDVDHVIHTLHNGGFRWRDIVPVYRMLKPYKFDLGVVLYNSEKGLSYLNVDSFALVAQPTYISSVNINKKESLLTTQIFIYKICHRLVDLLWLIINLICTTCILMIIFLVMMISVPFIFFIRILRGIN